MIYQDPQDISIDPGIGKTNGTGWALWSAAKQVVGVGLIRPPDDLLYRRARFVVEHLPMCPGQCFLEHMQIYGQQRQKGDPNDLVSVAYLEGMISARYASVSLFTPREWKGQRPDDVVQKHLEKTLSVSELAVIEATLRGVPKGLHHNVWSALGVGAHVFGRKYHAEM